MVDHATAPWGVKITRVEIKDIRPPADISNAMARQMKAEREKRAEILEAEGERAGRDPARRGREAVADPRGRRPARSRLPRRRGARARGPGRSQGDASWCPTRSPSGNAQAINYFVAQKYAEAVSEFATSPNAKTILFPVEATQLIGTLGGIAELARDALGGDRGPAPPTPPAPRERRPGPFEQN